MAGDMDIQVKDLLPLGSVVLLKNAVKKVVIMGFMHMKQTEAGDMVLYHYVGVPYPEGYFGSDAGLLFNHEQIEEVVFSGFSDEERDIFLEAIQQIADQTEKTVKSLEDSDH